MQTTIRMSMYKDCDIFCSIGLRCLNAICAMCFLRSNYNIWPNFYSTSISTWQNAIIKRYEACDCVMNRVFKWKTRIYILSHVHWQVKTHCSFGSITIIRSSQEDLTCLGSFSSFKNTPVVCMLLKLAGLKESAFSQRSSVGHYNCYVS